MNVNTNVYKQYIDSGRSYQKKGPSFASVLEKTASGTNKKDLFSLSSAASVFKENGREIKKAAEEISAPASEEKINDIRQRIRSGSYKVSSSQVADSILSRWI
ncbi:MAG: flagellar biosynthesis anti-sigma factor FlgM [Porcipelethomonas sp.]